MKYYVISDVHGFYSLMRESLEKAGYDQDPAPHKLIICGDLLDRGRETIKMVKFVLDLLKRDEVILIRGNHEDLLMELITDDHGLPLSHHRSNGTYQTALNLAGMTWQEARSDPGELCERVLASPFVRSVIPAMRDFFETKHYVFVHGWIPCETQTSRLLDMFLGISHTDEKADNTIKVWRDADEFLWSEARWTNGIKAAQTMQLPDKTVVCGHWHASYGHCRYEERGSEFGPDADFSPYYGPGVIAIDACTAHSQKVNCIVLEDEEG